MPAVLFTPQTAGAMAIKAAESRRRNTLKRKALIAAHKAGMLAINPPAPIAANPDDPPKYFEKRLARVRMQLDRLDEMMLREDNPQAIDRLAAAAARLAEQERIMDGRPLPGSHRPSKPSKKSDMDGTVTPE